MQVISFYLRNLPVKSVELKQHAVNGFAILKVCLGFVTNYGVRFVSISVAADLVCEFLEVAFHLILYIREVYPAVIFERRKKYNVPVQVGMSTEI